MRQSGGHSTDKLAVSADLIGHRLCTYLRRRHPRKTAETVAAETGIPQATVAKWIERNGSPSVPALIKLAHAYGPDVLTAVAPEIGWLGLLGKLVHSEALHRAVHALDDDIAATVRRLGGRS